MAGVDAPPIAVDIDGTLTRADGRGIDPAVFAALREWPAPVVIATGKAFPYPVALSEFIGLDPRVVAENGGVAVAGDEVRLTGDPEAIERVSAALREAGIGLGWGDANFANRWRRTELAVRNDRPLDRLTDIAGEHGLDVVDSGYAYHVKSPDVTKGRGLAALAESLGVGPDAFAAIGDAANDVPMFDVAGVAIAVGNAADAAVEAADRQVAETHADGLLAALETLRE
jgi:phosphoglycolate phosphatase (TIGR01487 family)